MAVLYLMQSKIAIHEVSASIHGVSQFMTAGQIIHFVGANCVRLDMLPMQLDMPSARYIASRLDMQSLTAIEGGPLAVDES